jgi:hypothetical protein
MTMIPGKANATTRQQLTMALGFPWSSNHTLRPLIYR